MYKFFLDFFINFINSYAQYIYVHMIHLKKTNSMSHIQQAADFDVGGICKKNKEVSKIVDRPSPAARRQQNL
jgi:hypothetical protein